MSAIQNRDQEVERQLHAIIMDICRNDPPLQRKVLLEHFSPDAALAHPACSVRTPSATSARHPSRRKKPERCDATPMALPSSP
jgi:hypothetical protein